MSLVLDRLESKNSNIDKPLKKKTSKFMANELNIDTFQSNLMKENYENLKKNSYSQLFGNGYESVNDNMDYIGCLTGNGTKLVNETVDVNESINDKAPGLVIDKKINTNFTLMKSIDMLISIIYIAILVFFFIGWLINREPDNIVNALILTLIYIFYKITARYINLI